MCPHRARLVLRAQPALVPAAVEAPAEPAPQVLQSSGMLSRQQLLTLFAKFEAVANAPDAVGRLKAAIAKGIKVRCDVRI